MRNFAIGALIALAIPFIVTAQNTYQEPIADGTITLSGPETIAPGTRITYTAVASNMGPEDLSDPHLWNEFPAGLIYDGVNSDSRCTEVKDAYPPSFSCSFGSIKPGQESTLKVSFVVSPSVACNSTLTQKVTLFVVNDDPEGKNNLASVTTKVDCSSSASSSEHGSLLDLQDVTFTPLSEYGDHDMLSMRVCNEGSTDYLVSEHGSISFRITINGKYGYVVPTGAKYDLKAGDCRSLTIKDIMGSFSPIYLKGIPQGDYDMEFSLQNTPAANTHITKKVHIGNTTFSFVSAKGSSTGFPDVTASHTSFDAISYLKKNDIVAGYSDGTFKPDSNITRAEFTKIVILSYLSKIELELSGCFSFDNLGLIMNHSNRLPKDVNDNDWAASYICAAVTQGMVSGYPDGTFKQNNNISFVEAAKILAKSFLKSPEPLMSTTSEQWFESYVRDMQNAGAIPLSLQRFDQLITRAEMAEMVYRLKEGITTKQSATYATLAANSGLHLTQQIGSLPPGWKYRRISETPFEIPLPPNASFAQSVDATTDVYPIPEKDRTPQSIYSFYLSFKSCPHDTWCDPYGKAGGFLYPQIQSQWSSEDGKVQVSYFAPDFYFPQHLYSITAPDGLYYAKLHILGIGEQAKADAATAILRLIRLSQ